MAAAPRHRSAPTIAHGAQAGVPEASAEPLVTARPRRPKQNDRGNTGEPGDGEPDERVATERSEGGDRECDGQDEGTVRDHELLQSGSHDHHGGVADKGRPQAPGRLGPVGPTVEGQLDHVGAVLVPEAARHQQQAGAPAAAAGSGRCLEVMTAPAVVWRPTVSQQCGPGRCRRSSSAVATRVAQGGQLVVARRSSSRSAASATLRRAPRMSPGPSILLMEPYRVPGPRRMTPPESASTSDMIR